MLLRCCTAALLALLSVPTRNWGQAQMPPAVESAVASCPVTIPREAPVPLFDRFFGYQHADWHGKLYVGALWPSGTIIFGPHGPGFRFADGSMGMKISWYRAPGLRGLLTIRGKRLDAPAAPLRATMWGHSEAGFQPTTLVFPTEGCWEVTGEVAHTSVTFVTRVIKISSHSSRFPND